MLPRWTSTYFYFHWKAALCIARPGLGMLPYDKCNYSCRVPVAVYKAVDIAKFSL